MCTGWRKSGLASLCLASHAIIFPFESDVAFQGFPDSNVSLMSGHTQSPTILYLGTHDVTFMLCPQISDSVFRLDFRKFDLENVLVAFAFLLIFQSATNWSVFWLIFMLKIHGFTFIVVFHWTNICRKIFGAVRNIKTVKAVVQSLLNNSVDVSLSLNGHLLIYAPRESLVTDPVKRCGFDGELWC